MLSSTAASRRSSPPTTRWGTSPRGSTAAFNRGTLLANPIQPDTSATQFYRAPVTNHYARLVHAATAGGDGYAFPYDDVHTAGYNTEGSVVDGKPTRLTGQVRLRGSASGLPAQHRSADPPGRPTNATERRPGRTRRRCGDPGRFDGLAVPQSPAWAASIFRLGKARRTAAAAGMTDPGDRRREGFGHRGRRTPRPGPRGHRKHRPRRRRRTGRPWCGAAGSGARRHRGPRRDPGPATGRRCRWCSPPRHRGR